MHVHLVRLCSRNATKDLLELARLRKKTDKNYAKKHDLL